MTTLLQSCTDELLNIFVKLERAYGEEVSVSVAVNTVGALLSSAAVSKRLTSVDAEDYFTKKLLEALEIAREDFGY